MWIPKDKTNKGNAGIDGVSTEELSYHLQKQWPIIRSQLLSGKYQPNLIRRVDIPKPGSKDKRKLGIPTTVDRFIQQALLQILQPKWDGFFSDNSFGFRPNRSAHQAVLKAQRYIEEGYNIVVDIDLSKFFDRICHDRLMSKLRDSIPDKRILHLIRCFLSAGILDKGLVAIPTEGSIQGGPLSPILSNIVLDELDKELEKRGHKFVRYADDCNIYVKSIRSGGRVKSSITKYLEHKLKLVVNEDKSSVDRPSNRKFLGFTFTGGYSYPNRIKISPESIKRFKSKVRHLSRRNCGKGLESIVKGLSSYLTGWKSYYGLCQSRSILKDLDSWIRRRLRCIQWKQWKIYACRKRELINLGIRYDLAQTTAWSSKGHWKMSQSPGVCQALSIKYFERIGLTRLYSK